jgi:predicted  nucleic acid-binding Zn-ribbon protein
MFTITDQKELSTFLIRLENIKNRMENFTIPPVQLSEELKVLTNRIRLLLQKKHDYEKQINQLMAEYKIV